MGFISGVRLGFASVFSDRTVFSTMILAVILYGFFYPAAYHGQVAVQMPVVVVDMDNSALSRNIVQKASAVRAVKIVGQTVSFNEAKNQLAHRKADAVLLIPNGLEASVLRGKPGGVALYLSGAYLLRTRELGAGLAGAIAGAVTEVIKPAAEALGVQPVINLIQRPLYNTFSGYGSYVVPAVAVLIVHQTLLLGVAMLVCQQRKKLARELTLPGFLGMSSSFILIGSLSCCYFFGFVFWFQDYPRGGNLLGMLIATPIFASSVVMLAILLGTFFDRPERPAQVITFTSVPFFLLSGASWPLSAMPAALATLAWVVPSTAGVRAFVKLNQMGAGLSDVYMESVIMLGLSMIFGVMAYRRLALPPIALADLSD